MKSGIYAIVNIVTYEMYVGSATNLTGRFAKHRHDLRKGIGKNKLLQKSWDEHGEQNFEFRVLIRVCKCDLIKSEQKCFDILNPVFNILRVAGSSEGLKHSDHTKNKMSAKHKKRNEVRNTTCNLQQNGLSESDLREPRTF